MFLQSLVALLCIIAGIACLASASDGKPRKAVLLSARKITGITMLSAGAYIVYMLIEFGTTSQVMCYFLGLLALAQILFAANAVLDHDTVARASPPVRGVSNANHA